MFGTVKLTKNAYPDKYKYSGFGFAESGSFSLSDCSGFVNGYIDISSCVHSD